MFFDEEKNEFIGNCNTLISLPRQQDIHLFCRPRKHGNYNSCIHVSKKDTRTLYSAALILKMLLCDSPGMTFPLAPTSDDLNETAAKSVG